MAIRINDVKLITTYGWNDINNLGDWGAVRNTNISWQQLYYQTTRVGQPVKIEVDISEDNWLNIRESFNTWETVKSSFNSWLDIKNY